MGEQVNAEPCRFCRSTFVEIAHESREQTIVTRVKCTRCGAAGPWANGPDELDNAKRAALLWNGHIGDTPGGFAKLIHAASQKSNGLPFWYVAKELGRKADARIAELEAEVAAMQVDAERYRFLRSANCGMRNRLEHYADSALDVAIDEARKGGGDGNG